jgi:hypothetical protein
MVRRRWYTRHNMALISLVAGHDPHHPTGGRRRDVPEGEDTVLLLLCPDRPVILGPTRLACQRCIH